MGSVKTKKFGASVGQFWIFAIFLLVSRFYLVHACQIIFQSPLNVCDWILSKACFIKPDVQKCMELILQELEHRDDFRSVSSNGYIVLRCVFLTNH